VKQLEDSIAAINGPALTQTELKAIDEFAVNGTGAY
jgi:hypothetical protein